MNLTIMLRVLLATHLTTQSFIRCAKLSSLRRVPTESIKRVVVVGGGAAGYFSAIECAKLLSESQEKEKKKIRYEVKERIFKMSTVTINQKIRNFPSRSVVHLDTINNTVFFPTIAHMLLGYCFRSRSDAVVKSAHIRYVRNIINKLIFFTLLRNHYRM